MYFRVKLDWIRFGGLLCFLMPKIDYILVTAKYSNTDSLSSHGEVVSTSWSRESYASHQN